MVEQKNLSDRFAELRRQATERMKSRFPDASKISELSSDDVQRLVHELQVYQIELEIQNEDLRHTQRALEESRNRYSDLYDFAPVGYLTVDRKGVIVEANHTAAAVLEVPRDEMIGKPFHKFVFSESQDNWYLCHRRVYKSEKIQTCEIQMRKHTGETFHARLESILMSKNGRATELCRTVVSDISDLKQAELRITAALEEKEVLLREIHHRVKNNLALITSLLRFRTQYSTDKTPQEMFDEINARIRSMAITHEILYQSDNLANLTMRNYIDNLLTHIRYSYRRVGSSIEVDQEIEDVFFGLDTAIPLGILLTELVSNCFKHAFPDRSEGRISVSLTSVADQEFQLVVKDNGIGMPDTVDLEKTSSFGLDLINAFVEQLQGKIGIRREAGTEVVIRLKAGAGSHVSGFGPNHSS